MCVVLISPSVQDRESQNLAENVPKSGPGDCVTDSQLGNFIDDNVTLKLKEKKGR